MYLRKVLIHDFIIVFLYLFVHCQLIIPLNLVSLPNKPHAGGTSDSARPQNEGRSEIGDSWKWESADSYSGNQDARGNDIMNQIGVSFRKWCREQKLETPPSTWNLHLVGRGDNDSKNSYPVLDSNVKAAHTKPVILFVIPCD